jgi:hypothetical protein
VNYTVRYGDTLSGIAAETLGDAERWPAIAQANNLRDTHHLFVGQMLVMPTDARASAGPRGANSVRVFETSHPSTPPARRPATALPARAFLFVLADEIDPVRRKLVRKVIFPKDLQGDPTLIRRILDPQMHGFSARAPGSPVSVGRHVLGRTDSAYVSASERPLGSPRFTGERYWIDVEKVKRSGAVIHEGKDIARDLDRIAARTKNREFLSYIEEIRQKALIVDREVLIEGEIAAVAVKGARAMALTRGLQFVQGVGLVVSAYDLATAGAKSYREGSVKPIAAESLRQMGGWAAAFAGLKLGAAAGAMVGIETGPGAVLTAAAGGFVGGVAGYFGFDWIADRIHRN